MSGAVKEEQAGVKEVEDRKMSSALEPGRADVVDGAPLFPGFRLPVADVFP